MGWLLLVGDTGWSGTGWRPRAVGRSGDHRGGDGGFTPYQPIGVLEFAADDLGHVVPLEGEGFDDTEGGGSLEAFRSGMRGEFPAEGTEVRQEVFAGVVEAVGVCIDVVAGRAADHVFDHRLRGIGFEGVGGVGGLESLGLADVEQA